KRVQTAEQAAAAGPTADYGGWIDVGITELGGLDFVGLDRALREDGMVASRIEFGGPAPLRLEAGGRCCGGGGEARDRILNIARARPAPRLRWVDSVTVSRGGQRVTVHARYQASGDTVDVADLLGTFDEAGLPALSLHVLTGEEGKEAPTGEDS